MIIRSLFVLTLVCVFTLSARSQVVINEICASNGDTIYDPQYFNFSGWVELHNAGTAEVNVGNYFLSDDPTIKTKWQIPANTKIPAKGILLIWCDDTWTGLHTNFNLDADGETLILSNSAQTTLDQITYPEQFTNISYGRITNGSSTWSYINSPTPGTSNSSSQISIQLQQPTLSVASGKYSSTQQVTLTHPTPGVQMRYTTDGSEPISTSTLFSQPISVNKTLTLKAKAFHSDYISSKTTTSTYIIDTRSFTLPIVSISTKPSFLNDNTIGIYVDGTNGIAGNCKNEPVNWNQDWDRHAVFEYFTSSGVKEYDKNIDIRIGGACSRNNAQKSLVLRARDKYGDNTMDYKFFDTKENNSFGGLTLRNSGNDFYSTMFRDALLQTLPLGQMDIDYMAYQPSTVFLNGQYWGIMNLREKIDGDYIESNFAIDKSDVDLLETGGGIIEGSNVAYNTFLNNLSQMDPNDPATFTYIDQNIDVQEYINYLTAEIYYANTDWPGNNTKFWRQRSTNGKFRWILWDTDFGFGLYDGASWPTHPTFDFATDPDNTGWPNPDWSTLLIRLVLANPEFRTRFVQTFTTAMGTTFKPERVIGMIDQFQARIASEMNHHVVRWGNSMDNWNYNVQLMRNFATARNTYMQGHTASFFGLNGTLGNLQVTGTPTAAAAFEINGVYNDVMPVALPYYNGLAYQVVAKPKAGYAFKSWKITKQDATNIPMIDQGSSWKYFDLGSLPAADWMNTGYNDNTWAEGNAQLGYGNDGEVTIISYGPDAGNKYITSYFRKNFSVTSTDNLQDISARILFDDGVVVYLNGQEVYRNNLPEGIIDYNTLAPVFIDPERTFHSFTISKDLLQTGNNTIAVEVHQNSGGSSDLSFDFVMSTVKLGAITESTSTNITYNDIAFGNVTLEATFENTQPISGIVINEVSASNSTHEDSFGETDDWIELYNNGNSAVNLTGLFITDKLTNKLKHQLAAGIDNEMTLQPGEYKLLWADEQPNQGATHLTFKLSADGEAVGLYQKIGEQIFTLDEISFEATAANLSFSRIPNGTGNHVLTTHTTPGSENIFEAVVGNEEESEDFSGVIYPNPTSGTIKIKTEKIIDQLMIYNYQCNLAHSTTDIKPDQVISLPSAPGLYIVIIKLGGQSKVFKVIRQ